MPEALITGPGRGEVIREMPERSLHINADTDAVTMIEMRYAPGDRGPDPHVHHTHADAFWVLEGEIELRLGPDLEPVRLGPGGFALAPPDLVHTFRNPGPAEARYLSVHAPGSQFGDYLRANRDRDPERAARFDQHPPPEDGGRPRTDAVVHEPGEGELARLGDSSATLKASGDDGDGHLAVIELDFAPGGPGPVPHRHERMTDSFYVLEGELTLVLGEGAQPALPGTYVVVPPGVVHAFRNDADERVRVLNVMVPAGLERYLPEVAAAMQPGEAPDPAVMAAIASRYDFHPAAGLA
jgi:quercetin dioxygenase-like cupin family protein